MKIYLFPVVAIVYFSSVWIPTQAAEKDQAPDLLSEDVLVPLDVALTSREKGAVVFVNMKTRAL